MQKKLLISIFSLISIFFNSFDVHYSKIKLLDNTVLTLIDTKKYIIKHGVNIFKGNYSFYKNFVILNSEYSIDEIKEVCVKINKRLKIRNIVKIDFRNTPLLTKLEVYDRNFKIIDSSTNVVINGIKTVCIANEKYIYIKLSAYNNAKSKLLKLNKGLYYTIIASYPEETLQYKFYKNDTLDYVYSD